MPPINRPPAAGVNAPYFAGTENHWCRPGGRLSFPNVNAFVRNFITAATILSLTLLGVMLVTWMLNRETTFYHNLSGGISETAVDPRYIWFPFGGVPVLPSLLFVSLFPLWSLVLWIKTTCARVAIRRRRRMISDSICPNCRYDLRFTPCRCPECGERITPSAISPRRTAPSSPP
jgi:hypothetical protein